MGPPERGDLGQMRDGNDLARSGEAPQAPPDGIGDAAGRPRVRLVENQGRRAPLPRPGRLQRQKEPR